MSNVEILEAVPLASGSARADASTMAFVIGVNASRQQIVVRNDEDRSHFLWKRTFAKAEPAKIIKTVRAEQGPKPKSTFDYVKAITCMARESRIRIPGLLSKEMSKCCSIG